MDCYDVPPAHLAHCVENSTSLALVRSEEIVQRTPCLPFPVNIQTLVDAQLPFVLVVGEKQRPYFQPAFAEPTPHRNQNGHGPVSAAYVVLQIALAKSLGVPYSQIVGNLDAIVQNVFPAEDQLDNPDTSAGSQRPFRFHTDKSCTIDRSPDWVTLACIRNSEGGTTSVSSIHKIVDLLSKSQSHELEGNNFRFGSNTANIGPILTRDGQDALRVRLSTHMAPLTLAAESAYRQFLQAAQEAADSVTLESGEILFLPNKTCVHGRDGFYPHEDSAQRRFLQRVYVRK